MLRLDERTGSPGDDVFDAAAFGVHFGLDGDDYFQSRPSAQFAVAIGGPGADTYVVANNSSLTVADLGGDGSDTLSAQGIGLYSPTSYSGIINGQHFVAGDTASGQVVYVPDFRDPRQALETILLRDGQTSYEALREFVDQNGTSLGNTTWSRAGASGYTGAELEEAIDFYQQRAGELLAESRGGPVDERIDLDGRQGRVEAGDGLDTGTLSQPRSDYDVTANANLSFVSGAGTDVLLVDVERLEFADGRLAFDETAERAYRLYEAALGRQPDPEGLGYWIDRLDDGMSFNQVAGSFIDSNEFRGLSGAEPSNQQFVDLVYENVLGREPDAGGAGYWIDQLTGGMSRAEALARFSDSEENRANVADQIDDGVFYI